MSPPRVVLRSAGRTSSFDCRRGIVEGHTFVCVDGDGDEYEYKGVIERSEGS